jgi:hypothetical protein
MSYQFSCNWESLQSVPTDHGSVVIGEQSRLRLQTQTLMCAAQPLTYADWDPVVAFELLLLCQHSLLRLLAFDPASNHRWQIELLPLGHLRPVTKGVWETTLNQGTCDSKAELPICVRSATPGFDGAVDASFLLEELIGVPLVQALFAVLHDPRCQSLINPLLALNDANRTALLNHYSFRRSPETFGVAEESCLQSDDSVVNPSPTVRAGRPVTVDVLRPLMAQVFRKSQRGSLATDPPMPTFQAAYPTPGALASTDALLITTTGPSSVRLWRYNSISDDLDDLTLSHPALPDLAWQALDEARLNYASHIAPSALLLVMADLWKLQRKYRSGAFGLACLEAGVAVGTLQRRLPDHHLGGCLCGSIQAWPLCAFAGPRQPLIPLIGFALFGL